MIQCNYIVKKSKLISILLLLSFSYYSGCFYALKIKNKNMGQTTPHGIYPHMTPQTHKFVIIEGHMISNV